MDKEEISRYIRLGKARAISIDKQLLSQYPGIMRELLILADNRVQVRFADRYIEETDEAAVDFYFDYASDTDLVYAIESFIQKKLDRWTNYTNIQLEFPHDAPLDASWKQLKIDYVNKKLDFPYNWVKFVVPSPYWKALLDGELMVDSTYEQIREWVLNQSSQQ